MSSTEIVRVPVAIPPSLRDKLTVTEQDGVRMITGLDKMSETHNVLQPISEIAQADPDWSPRIVEVYIDPTLDPPKGNARQSYSGRHVYVQDKMLALNKNAIFLLAKAAGINVKTRRTRPDPEGAIEYWAYATLRRPDGTVEEWEDSREKTIEVEREKVKQTCMKDGALDQTYFLKRWTTERDFLPAKVESMAMLRVVSSALQLKRGGYTEDELRKPFLVIAWSLTPSDPAVRREIALHAAGVLSGRVAAPREIEEPEPDLALPAPSVETPAPSQSPPDVVDHVPPTATPVSQEPDPNEPEPVAGEIPADVAAAGQVIFGEGFRAAGKKVSEVRREYLTHVAFEMQFTPAQEPTVQACRTWAAWLNGQQVQP